MNKPKKCKNCQWYGKPYWSIINPCDSCPNENDYKTIIQIDGVPVIKEALTEEEIKIADQIGFTINESDLSTGKIVVNGVEVTDTESWNKAISTFTELEYQLEQKDKEIERLNNIINELEKEIKKVIAEGRSDDHLWLMGYYDASYDYYKKLKELKEGKE